MSGSKAEAKPEAAPLDPVEGEILRAVRAIRFGSVEIVIHDGKVVQIVRTEKVRVEGKQQGPLRA